MTVALLAVLVLAIAAAWFFALRRRSPIPGQLAQGLSAPPAAGSGPPGPIGREVSIPPGREVSIPPQLYEPHLGRPRKMVTVGTRRIDPREASEAVAARPSPHRPLASRFELPDGVRARLADPDDSVALVEALLDTAGLDVQRDGELLLVDDEAVVVVEAPVGEALGEDELSSAYVRFQVSGAGPGMLVTPGLLNAADVRRREAADPRFLHAGLDGLQRMADAVAAGTDPLAAAPRRDLRRLR